MREYRYLHLDVFTDTPFTGNQLAVFVDAKGLAPDVMQAIAREMAFSETTFVFPAETSDTDTRVRIFAPSAELPMAGHPTIGTTFALAHDKQIESNRSTVRLGLGVGPTAVSLEWESDKLRFAWMNQPLPEFGATISDMKSLASALSLEEETIGDTPLPIQVVSAGVPFLFVPVVSRDAVNRAVVDRAALLSFYQTLKMPELPLFVFTLDGDDNATAFSRMFAPGFGIVEDPATGGASGPLGGYLVHHRAVSAERATRMVSLQGVKMGRPSRIHISISAHHGLIERVLVGGQSVLIGEGVLRLPG
jgi:trans-2,3-dihydro-3-hydroxyanthranilate isomerase